MGDVLDRSGREIVENQDFVPLREESLGEV
jgi:hypothetical protein